jgi:oligopeptide transport system ATP-binding protein
MAKIGISIADIRARALDRCPHEFSGGQHQKIGIGRALASHPSLIICGGISVEAQVTNVLGDLQREFGLSYLLY